MRAARARRRQRQLRKFRGDEIADTGTRHHYVRVTVRVHRYVDGTLGVFHGPRKLAGYDARGNLPLQELKKLPDCVRQARQAKRTFHVL